MTDTGPTTTTIEREQPVIREKAEILQTRKDLTVSTRTGMLTVKDMSEALEFSQAMAKAGEAVPKHLRGSPGACLAILEYAHSWEMGPYGVANETYVVSDRLSFMGKLIHAVIKKRVPLRYPNMGLDCEYVGEGPDRKCIVSAEVWLDDEHTGTKVLKWESPLLKDITPKNSPLWKSDPDQQLFYRTSQRWQRRYFPEILLGIYSKEEMEDLPEEERAALAKDITPAKGTGLAARLTGGNGGEGFHPDNVRDLGGTTGAADELANIAADVQPVTQATTVKDAGMTHPAQTTESTGVTVSEPVQEGKSAPAPTATPIDPTPAAKPVEDKKPEPKDHDEYVAHLEAWLARAKDDAWVHDNYKDEKALRTRCGADITICNKMKNARLKELGAA